MRKFGIEQRVFVFLLGLVALMHIATLSLAEHPYSRSGKSRVGTALIETTKGPVEIEFNWDIAPQTVANFIKLARSGFYNNLSFHRYVEDFVIQGGDPKGNGSGGPGYTIPPELSETKHVRGTVGMARLPGEVNPERDSNGSQFYICFTEAPHLDGLYSVFAKVIYGIENAERLRPGDKILRIRLPRES